MDAGWSSEQVEGFCTVHGESDGGGGGLLLGCGRQPRPLLVERGGWVASGWQRWAGSNLRKNPRRQRAAHPPAGDPEPGADGGAPHGVVPSGARGRRRLDVSLAAPPSIRTARRAAEATAEEMEARRRRRRRQRRRSCCWAAGLHLSRCGRRGQHRWKSPPPSGRTARRPCAWRIPASPRQPRCCSCWWRSG
jgi:hypothetical protein